MTDDSLLAVPARVPEGSAAAVPLVVLSYSRAGSERLRDLLSGHPGLACTLASGLLPLCEQAAASWREVEGGHGEAPSALAAASIRAMTAGMAVALRARTGKRRWCEFSMAPPPAAGTFLRLFPQTRIACLHQSCPGFIRAALDAGDWGPSGPEFAPFVAAHPGSTVVALASYWAARSRALMDLEAEYPRVTQRIRSEELAAEPGAAVDGLLAFLEVRPGPPGHWFPDERGQANGAGGAPAPADRSGNLPAALLPPPLLQQVNRQHAELGYPPLRHSGG
jgi:hypothetical protein